MLDVNTRLKTPKRTIKPEMLVKYTPDGSIGLVHMVTKKWVHVIWMVNTTPEEPTKTEGGHHYEGLVERKDLEPCPVGTEVTIRQIARD